MLPLFAVQIAVGPCFCTVYIRDVARCRRRERGGSRRQFDAFVDGPHQHPDGVRPGVGLGEQGGVDVARSSRPRRHLHRADCRLLGRLRPRPNLGHGIRGSCPGGRVTNAVGTIFRKIFVGTRARRI